MNKVAQRLFLLSLAKSILLLMVVPPTFGPDGSGYLAYIDAFADPTITDAEWFIRGTTPIYPFFAYAAYWVFGLGSGLGIVLAQILLGALVAPLLYIALKNWHPQVAMVAGILIAIDPQTGIFYQLVATEGLYIALLGIGLAAFLWHTRRQAPLWQLFLLGILLGISGLSRPVGMFLLVPYAVFFYLIQRSVSRTAMLSAGYVAVVLFLGLLNLWRFDFFAPNNTSGLYLGTRLFSVGGLYDPANGEASQRLYDLAAGCDLILTDDADQDLVVTQNLRICLYFIQEMQLNDISTLYQDVYTESTSENPAGFITTMLGQMADFAWQFSDAYDHDAYQLLVTDCATKADSLPWYEAPQVFCPVTPTPLSFLAKPIFAASLLFSLLTRIAFFIPAALWIMRSERRWMWAWLWLLCLGLYAYHMVVTAAAGVILPRYVTVTNIYILIPAAITLVWAYVLIKSYFGSPTSDH